MGEFFAVRFPNRNLEFLGSDMDMPQDPKKFRIEIYTYASRLT